MEQEGIAVGPLLFLFLGLILLGVGAIGIVSAQSYSFKTKKLHMQEKIGFMLAGVGGFLLLCWLLIVIF